MLRLHLDKIQLFQKPTRIEQSLDFSHSLQLNEQYGVHGVVPIRSQDHFGASPRNNHFFKDLKLLQGLCYGAYILALRRQLLERSEIINLYQ